MKKILLLIICLISFMAVNVNAKQKVNVHLFTKDGCPYCDKMKTYIHSLEKDNKYKGMFEVIEYEVWDKNWTPNEETFEFYQKVATYKNDKIGAVPYLVVGNNYSVVGFNEDMQDEILKGITDAYNANDYKDVVTDIKNDKIKVDISNIGNEDETNTDDTQNITNENTSSNKVLVLLAIAIILINSVSSVVIIIFLNKISKKLDLKKRA